MTVIRMLTHMTTGRYDGREWPPYYGTFDVPEWEAKHLVNGGNAEYPEKPLLDRGYDVLKVADPDYESKLKPLDGEDPVEDLPAPVEEENRDDFDSDFEREEEVTQQVKRPYANAKKSEWIDYVVERGYCQYDEARNMTKDALMEMDS